MENAFKIYEVFLKKFYGRFGKPWQAHCRNVARLSCLFASHIYGCDQNFAYLYALVHDIGKSTERAEKDTRYHVYEGYRILDDLGLDSLKMSPLTHSFPNLSNLTLIPGYYNPYWDQNIDKTKLSLKIDPDIDIFIPSKLKGYEPNIYDDIVNIADLMSKGNTCVSITERLECVRKKYGETPYDAETEIAIFKKKEMLEKLMCCKIEDIVTIH